MNQIKDFEGGNSLLDDNQVNFPLKFQKTRESQATHKSKFSMVSGKVHSMAHEQFRTSEVLSLLSTSNLDKPSSNGRAVIVILCLVNYIANSAYSSIAPFYPDEEAIGKGLDS